jgi:hypothetical protein
VAQTPISGSTPYCAVADVIDVCDVRTLGDWLSDTGQRLTPGEVAASGAATERLYRFMMEASGELESAIFRGGRLTAADLAALTGNSLRKLKNLVAGYAVFLVWDRRPGTFANAELPARARKAIEDMDLLAAGERIFAFQETADAGRIDHEVEDESDVIDRNGAAYRARDFFGRRTAWHSW